jgi:26S proteasome regulatory subunit N1
MTKIKRRRRDEPKVDDTFQAFAVLGITLIAMGEDIGAKMSMRQLSPRRSHNFREKTPLTPI